MTESSIPFERLVAFSCDELSEANARAVEQALEADPDRKHLAARLRAVIASIAPPGGAESAPPAALARARAVAGACRRSATLEQLLGHARWVLAQLIYDSRAQVATAGFRGAPGAIMLAYELEGSRIDLQVTPGSGGMWTVRGQVDPAPSAASVSLIGETGDRAAAPAALDAGQFAVSCRAGRFDLAIEDDDGGDVVLVPDLQVGEEARPT